jgi:hypothetical protein
MSQSAIDTANLVYHNKKLEQLEYISLFAKAAISRSPELTSLIISHLIVPDNRASMYAMVSREWREQIERHRFSALHLAPARLDEFGRITQSRSRRANVCRSSLTLRSIPTTPRGVEDTRLAMSNSETTKSYRNSPNILWHLKLLAR